jgi:hypothetical protein
MMILGCQEPAPEYVRSAFPRHSIIIYVLPLAAHLQLCCSRVLGSLGTENRVKAQQHTAQQAAAIPLQKLVHKFWLLQGTFANGHTPIPP